LGRALPAITGNQLIKLLLKDGWERAGESSHVVSLRKKFSDQTRVTIVQPTNDSLPRGTLSAILGIKQTGLGRDGVEKLIDKHGLK
jgi:predicted RNA binding protein YcfA (HicA-like mRNA interferase family)